MRSPAAWTGRRTPVPGPRCPASSSGPSPPSPAPRERGRGPSSSRRARSGRSASKHRSGRGASRTARSCRAKDLRGRVEELHLGLVMDLGRCHRCYLYPASGQSVPTSRSVVSQDSHGRSRATRTSSAYCSGKRAGSRPVSQLRYHDGHFAAIRLPPRSIQSPTICGSAWPQKRASRPRRPRPGRPSPGRSRWRRRCCP